jgi:hypothetical protein
MISFWIYLIGFLVILAVVLIKAGVIDVQKMKWYWWVGGGILLFIILCLLKAYTLLAILIIAGIGFGFWYLTHKGQKALNKFMSRKVLPAMLKNKPKEEQERQIIRNYFTEEIAVLSQQRSNARMAKGFGSAGGIIGGGTGKLVGAFGSLTANGSNALNKLLPSTYDRGITDEQFDEIFNNRIAELGLRERALQTLGLDESQITELAPVCLTGYYVDESDDNIAAVGKDGVTRTCAYEVTWLFFTSKSLCIYQFKFNMWKGSQQEFTQEYFWRDITNFSNSSENVTIRNNWTGVVLGNTDVYYFTITVPGDKYKCIYKNTPEGLRSINGMKSYLREIKST